MSGGVAHLRFVAAEDPRPRLTPEVLERIATAVAEVTAAGDDGPAVLLLSGSRRAFALGADLGRLLDRDRTVDDAYLRRGHEVLEAIRSCPIPVIAMVDGLALGGGFELALAADIRWASRRAVFGLPEAPQGLVPAWGALPALFRNFPSALIWEIALGRRIGAGEARQLGLVGRIATERDATAWALAEAEEVAAAGRATLIAIKSIRRAPAAVAASTEQAAFHELAWRLDAYGMRTGGRAAIGGA